MAFPCFANPRVDLKYQCVQTALPPIIDGKLKEWQGVKGLFLNNPRQHVVTPGSAEGWKGPEDLSAIIYLMWDNKNLYLAADVTDDTFSQPEEGDLIWLGDSIQVAFDTLNDGRSDGYGEDDYEFGFALTAKGAIGWRWHATGDKKLGEVKEIKAAVVKKPDGKGLVYEVSIPWSELLPFQPDIGAHMGFNLIINDNDDKGRKGWLEWTPGIGISKDPSAYGNLVLVSELSPVQEVPQGYIYTEKGVYDDNEDVTTTLYIVASRDLGTYKVEFQALNGDKVLYQKPEEIKVDKGINKFRLSWNTGKLPKGKYELKVALYDAKGSKLDESNTAIVKLSSAAIMDKLKEVKIRFSQLKTLADQAKRNKIDISYPQASLTVIENFVQYAQDDIQAKKIERAERMADFLLGCCERTEKELKDLLRDPSKQLKVPKPKLRDLKIKGGSFYSGDVPVLLSGVGHFGQVRKDIPKLPNYGFNIIQIEMGPNSLLIGPDQYDLNAPKANIIQWLDLAAEHNIMVNVLISPHYFPGWAYDMYPDVRSCGRGFIDYCILNPHSREVLEKYLRKFIPMVSGHPALHSYCLANEPEFDERCDYALKRFRDWLQVKYQTIEKANSSWGTDFRSFEEVYKPRETDNKMGLRYDWLVFHQSLVTEFFSWIKRLIREYDKKTPVHIKVMPGVFDAGEGNWGLDRAALSTLSEINGCDCWVSYTPQDKRYIMGWGTQSIFYDFMRSLEPDKPIFNSENHIIPDDSPLYFPPEYIRAALWEGFLHGMGASTIWVWEREESPTLINNILTRPEAVEAAGRTSLDMMRLAKYIVEFPKAKSPAALLFSNASKLLSSSYLRETWRAYEGLYFLDMPVKFVSEAQIIAGKLKDYKLLIIPRAVDIKEETVTKIKQFVKDGGIILLTAESLKFDPYQRQRDLRDFLGLERAEVSSLYTAETAIFNLPQPKKIFLSDFIGTVIPKNARIIGKAAEKPVLTVNNYGKGKVYYLASSLSPEDYRSLFEYLMKEAKIHPPLWVTDEKGARPWGIEARTVELQGRKVTYLVNLSKEKVTVKLNADKPIKQIISLIANQPMELKPIPLNPLDVLLLELH